MKVFGVRSALFEETPGAAGGGNAPPLDEKTIKSWIDGSVNGLATRLEKETKTRFGEFGTKLDSFTSLLESLKPAQKTEGEKTGNEIKEGDLPPAVKAQLDNERKEREKLALELRGEKEARTASEKKADQMDRESAIRKEMSKYRFASEAEAETVFDVVASKIARGDDGSLIVGDTTLAGFVDGYLAKRPGLLAPENLNGSGAGPGGGKKGAIDVDSISSSSTKEQKQAYLNEIQRVANAAGKR